MRLASLPRLPRASRAPPRLVARRRARLPASRFALAAASPPRDCASGVGASPALSATPQVWRFLSRGGDGWPPLAWAPTRGAARVALRVASPPFHCGGSLRAGLAGTTLAAAVVMATRGGAATGRVGSSPTLPKAARVLPLRAGRVLCGTLRSGQAFPPRSCRKHRPASPSRLAVRPRGKKYRRRAHNPTIFPCQRTFRAYAQVSIPSPVAPSPGRGAARILCSLPRTIPARVSPRAMSLSLRRARRRPRWRAGMPSRRFAPARASLLNPSRRPHACAASLRSAATQARARRAFLLAEGIMAAIAHPFVLRQGVIGRVLPP